MHDTGEVAAGRLLAVGIEEAFDDGVRRRIAGVGDHAHPLAGIEPFGSRQGSQAIDVGQQVADLLALGIPVFYIENNVDVLEQANGQRFEIEYTRLARGAYKIVRELPRVA